jgi:hypothetical protein
MSLVKGFTDILTPDNLFTNSNFDRGGGLSNPLTLSTSGTSISTAQKVCDEWYIQGINSSWSNIIVTRDTSTENKTITIEATLSSVDGSPDRVYLKLFQKFWVIPGQLYTICGKCTYKSENIQLVYPSSSGSTTIYLSNIEVYIASLKNAVSDYSFGFLARVSGSSAIGTTIKFTIKEPALYRGAFVNPPYRADPTSIYTSRYVLTTDMYKFESNFRSVNINKKGWINLFLLRSGNVNTVIHGKIGMRHGYSNGFPEVYEIEFGYAFRPSTTSTKVETYMIIPKIYRQQNDNIRMTSFRIAKDGDDVYLQCYHNYTTNNTWYTWLDDFSSLDGCKNLLRLNVASKDPTVSSNEAITINNYISKLVMTNVVHDNYTIFGTQVSTINALQLPS